MEIKPERQVNSRNDKIGLSLIAHEEAKGLDRLSHTHLICEHATTPNTRFLLSHPGDTLELERKKFDLETIGKRITRLISEDAHLEPSRLQSLLGFDDLSFLQITPDSLEFRMMTIKCNSSLLSL